MSGMRAHALALALFAITLNFLQPLAHAALMRDGAPWALWTAFCNSTSADPDGKSGQPPATAGNHDCCLGLAHAPAIATPAVVAVAFEPVVTFVSPLSLEERFTPVGIRDGPKRPRGPPSLV
jgi:hypothetical protein